MVPLLAGSNWGSDVSVEGFKRGSRHRRERAIQRGESRVLPHARRAADGGAGVHRLPIPPTSPKVAIVNEAFTKKFNLGRDAVGKHMSTGEDKTKLDTEIVGVVQDAKYSEVKAGDPAALLPPVPPVDERVGSTEFLRARVRRSGAAVLRSLPGVMARLDPNAAASKI